MVARIEQIPGSEAGDEHQASHEKKLSEHETTPEFNATAFFLS
jgi:hypothetical protein